MSGETIDLRLEALQDLLDELRTAIGAQSEAGVIAAVVWRGGGKTFAAGHLRSITPPAALAGIETLLAAVQQHVSATDGPTAADIAERIIRARAALRLMGVDLAEPGALN
mgnify:CR=1 FL=1